MCPSARFVKYVSSPILWCITLCCLAPSHAYAGGVTLMWDPNSEPDLAGYKVYYGKASRTYGTPIPTGLETVYTLANLAPGTYYFAVTAFNTAGLESGFSNEVSTTITGTATGCDVSGDGQVDSTDVQTLANILFGALPDSAYDINKDGKVNIVDLQTLVNVVLGLRSCP